MLRTCELCHLTYVTDVPSDAAMHRRRHARYRSVLEGEPNPKFVEHLQSSGSSFLGELVTNKSAKWLDKEIYWRARFFKEEFGYDYTQWGGNNFYKNKNPRWQGHLFSINEDGRPTGRIGGACGFYFKDFNQWSLAWAWVAPPYRRSGLLTQRWQSFLEHYGDFMLETPLSPAMQSFILQHGTQQQRELATQRNNAIWANLFSE